MAALSAFLTTTNPSHGPLQIQLFQSTLQTFRQKLPQTTRLILTKVQEQFNLRQASAGTSMSLTKE